MRLSSVVIAAILFVSVTLLAEHSSAAGGSGSGGYSGGGSSAAASAGFSSGSSSSSSSHSSHASSAGSAGSTRNSGSSSSSGGTTNRGKTGSGTVRSSNDRAQNGKPEKKSAFSFLRHKKPAPEPAFAPVGLCKKGQNCPVCPGGGTRNAAGQCISPTQTSCLVGQVLIGAACSQYWPSDCEALARQLEAQKRRMQGRVDPGESLIYRMLLDQYQQCLQRFGGGRFGSYALDEAFLLDTP